MGILKKSRAIDGKKQWEMAECIGKSITTVSNYENNDEGVSIGMYRRWYNALEQDDAKRYFIDSLIKSFINGREA